MLYLNELMNMKKVMFFVMLLLSTSMAMAQFGKLEDIGKKQESNGEIGGENNHKSLSTGTFTTGGEQSTTIQLIDQTVKNAFFLVSQEYQVEDASIPGSRYNWGDAQWFGKNTSFMVRLTDGFITTQNIVEPQKDDENFKSLQGTFNPIMSKTSVLRVGDNEWSVEKTFNPKGNETLANNLHYVTDPEWGKGGLQRATGTGKKQVYVVWMEVGEGDPAKSITLKTIPTEIDIVQDSTLYDLKTPSGNRIMGGIVVEAVTDGMGQLNLALLGVAVKNGNKYQMALLGSDMGKKPSDGQHQEDNDNKDKNKDKKKKK